LSLLLSFVFIIVCLILLFQQESAASGPEQALSSLYHKNFYFDVILPTILCHRNELFLGTRLHQKFVYISYSPLCVVHQHSQNSCSNYTNSIMSRSFPL